MSRAKGIQNCIVEECGRKVLARSMCCMHYSRWYLGRPVEGPRRPSAILPKHHPFYVAWTNMKTRCRNPNSTQWKWYGGRGITYCERWEDFEYFFEDMFVGWQPGLTLDRRNGNGNYEPGNCRWIARPVQALTRNKRGYLEQS